MDGHADTMTTTIRPNSKQYSRSVELECELIEGTTDDIFSWLEGMKAHGSASVEGRLEFFFQFVICRPPLLGLSSAQNNTMTTTACICPCLFFEKIAKQARVDHKRALVIRRTLPPRGEEKPKHKSHAISSKRHG